MARRPPTPPDDAGAWDDLPPRPSREVDLAAPDDEDTDPWAPGPVERKSAPDLSAPGDDDVALELDEAERTRPERFDLADEPVILPWCGPARIDGRELTVILDPTVARSRWVRPGAPAGVVTVEVQLGGRALSLDIAVADGAVDEIRLGRDALAGRVWVSC